MIHSSRPDKKQKKRISVRFLIFGVLFVVLVISGYLVFREGTLPVNAQNTTSVIFTIEPGESINSIIRRLKSEGLIRNRLVFYTVVRISGIEKRIQAGKFRLSPSMDAKTLAEELTHGTNDTWITIIEGLRKEEVAEEIKEHLGIPVIEITSRAREGYLFPDTYLVPAGITAEGLLREMSENYETKVTPAIIASARERGLSEEELIILASLVEREARSEAARRAVAAIMLRRLRENMPLQIDATVQYALGYSTAEKSWWRKRLTLDDLKIDHPYNTYKNTGLPPGPIASPSLLSIIAVAEADMDTPYLYYITGNDNKMYYAETYEKHQENIRKYLR
ncbi:MAG: endolytic transglycosylase MltG [Patescibacteria group bacterium]|nr:endolytic transglycosylase MltG [Patescibacteria group bacterium]